MKKRNIFNPLMGTLKSQSNEQQYGDWTWYTGRWWVAVTFGKVRRGLGRSPAQSSPPH